MTSPSARSTPSRTAARRGSETWRDSRAAGGRSRTSTGRTWCPAAVRRPSTKRRTAAVLDLAEGLADKDRMVDMCGASRRTPRSHGGEGVHPDDLQRAVCDAPSFGAALQPVDEEPGLDEVPAVPVGAALVGVHV